jgi:hypothetical protein
MASYVVTFNNGTVDIVFSSYDSARNIDIPGKKYIYCAPDKYKLWHSIKTMPKNKEVWCLFFESPQRVIREDNTIKFMDKPNNKYPLNIIDGWLPLEWFRYVEPDDNDMRYWQMEDEYGR